MEGNLPSKINFIRTSGREEGEGAYTRANNIVIPRSFKFNNTNLTLISVLFHEVFHVLSRANPGLRDKLYKVIGFHRVKELPFPT